MDQCPLEEQGQPAMEVSSQGHLMMDVSSCPSSGHRMRVSIELTEHIHTTRIMLVLDPKLLSEYGGQTA